MYRIPIESHIFKSTLVQMIKIGFTGSELWQSADGNDIRPYGNFVIDRENKRLYAFTMRDQERKTRFFEFDMPKHGDGKYAPEFDLPVVTLSELDVRAWFDSEYINFMQGAAYHDGCIYSTEGFTNSVRNPALRVFDVKEKKQVLHVDLRDLGLHIEAEFVDVYNGETYYIDSAGDAFKISFT